MEAEGMRSAVPSIRGGRDFRVGIVSGASQGRRCRECSLSRSSKKSHMHLAGVTFWSGVPWSKPGKKTQGISPSLSCHGEVPLPPSNERLQKLISGASQGRKRRGCCSSCSCWQRPPAFFQGESGWLGLAPEVSQGKKAHRVLSLLFRLKEVYSLFATWVPRYWLVRGQSLRELLEKLPRFLAWGTRIVELLFTQMVRISRRRRCSFGYVNFEVPMNALSRKRESRKQVGIQARSLREVSRLRTCSPQMCHAVLRFFVYAHPAPLPINLPQTLLVIPILHITKRQSWSPSPLCCQSTYFCLLLCNIDIVYLTILIRCLLCIIPLFQALRIRWCKILILMVGGADNKQITFR